MSKRRFLLRGQITDPNFWIKAEKRTCEKNLTNLVGVRIKVKYDIPLKQDVLCMYVRSTLIVLR